MATQTRRQAAESTWRYSSCLALACHPQLCGRLYSAHFINMCIRSHACVWSLSWLLCDSCGYHCLYFFMNMLMLLPPVVNAYAKASAPVYVCWFYVSMTKCHRMHIYVLVSSSFCVSDACIRSHTYPSPSRVFWTALSTFYLFSLIFHGAPLLGVGLQWILITPHHTF